MRYRDFFKQKYFELNFKNIALFLALFLFNGFSIGTVMLLGPVRWIADLRDTLQFTQRTEDFLIKIVIVLLVVISFYISLLMSSLLTKRKSFLISSATLLTLIIITTGMIWLWMNPALIQAYDGIITQENVGEAEFLFGPYPTEHDLLRLKGEGITAVVSLLHPAVVPFEPKLLEDEKQTTEKIGLRLIEVPMLPWISENKESINKIIEIAEGGKGKYYVHCYLGKDRVNVVKRIIRRFSSSITEFNKDSIRTLESITFFERGDIIRLEDGVYLTPYPTDDEMFTYLLNGSIKQIVSLLNPDHPPDTMWINKERKICETHFMPFEVIPLKTNFNSAKSLMEIVEKTKSMPRPLVIHAFRSKSSRTREFVKAYKLSLSEEPSSKFTNTKK